MKTAASKIRRNQAIGMQMEYQFDGTDVRHLATTDLAVPPFEDDFERTYDFAGRFTFSTTEDGGRVEVASLQTRVLLPSAATQDPLAAPPVDEGRLVRAGLGDEGVLSEHRFLKPNDDGACEQQTKLPDLGVIPTRQRRLSFLQVVGCFLLRISVRRRFDQICNKRNKQDRHGPNHLYRACHLAAG